MEIRFHVMGAARKAFVTVVGDLVGWEPIYKKAPTFAYVVNNLTIDKEGTLLFPEDMDVGEAAGLLSALAAQGYTSGDTLPIAVSLGVDAPDEGAPAEGCSAEPAEVRDRLSIDLPLEGFTDQALDNLHKLVNSKVNLICKAIGAEELVIQHDGERIYFPWFAPDSTPEEVEVYTQLVSALCKMAKDQQRITATSREVENPKYAMRCFLLRLCFIGDEYAAARRLLLRNLSGNSSFKSGARKESPAQDAPPAADSAPNDAEDVGADPAPNPSETAHTGGDNAPLETLADAVLIHEVNALY